MIIDMVRGDIFKSPHKHVAFAVNVEGYNDAGFAGQVSSRYWRDLANTGKKQLGDILTRKMDDKTFHAIVCHALTKEGWHYTAVTVEKCLDRIEAPMDEVIGVVLMGGGMIGQMSGADVFAILGSMARVKRMVVVYTL